MQISNDVWQALRRAVERDDDDTFETIVVALVRQCLRDESGRRAMAQRDRTGDPPWLANAR